MTYKQLIQALENLSEEQLNSDITFMDTDGEFYAGVLSFASPENEADGVLDDGHPYIKEDGSRRSI